MTADMLLEYLARALDWAADGMHRLSAKVFLMDAEQRSYLDYLVIAAAVSIVIYSWKRLFRPMNYEREEV